MELDNQVVVDAPAEQVWAFLTDINQVARCVPGVVLGDADKGVHDGAVKLRVGPVTAEYRGTTQIIDQDDTELRVVIDSIGSDTRGTSNARAVVTAELADLGSQTRISVGTDLTVTGVAQLGRGMMQDISGRVLRQFADCLVAKISQTPKPVADDDPLDLLTVAGSAVAKRVVPMAAAAFVVLVLLLVLLF